MTAWEEPTAWYDVLNPWGPSDDFYLELVMAAGSVLDVGCGTGMLLERARDRGHPGHLCGLDPDPAMLDQARARRRDIEWVLSDAASTTWDQDFELAVMASHAFQVLVDDDDLRRSLRAIRAALVHDGRFAFETRHPQARAWEQWHDASLEADNPDGERVLVSYRVERARGDVVWVSETFSGRWWAIPRVDRGALRFLDPGALAAFLDEAGFVVDEQFGDWQRGPLTGASAEIVTIARRA